MIWEYIMFNHLILSFFVLLFSFNVSASSSFNNAAKNETLNIGKEISWKIDKKYVVAAKSASDKEGNYYHLQFDNKQLKLIISSDAKGEFPKKLNRLEIKDVKVDGKQNLLFKKCLANQQRHDRFLQQGLTVMDSPCIIDGDAGSFVMQLNKEALLALMNAKRLSIKFSFFRTQIVLNYDISDFEDMFLALNAEFESIAIVAAPKQTSKKCWAGPPAKYTYIRPAEYDCSDNVAKKEAEAGVIKRVRLEIAKEQKIAAIAAEKTAKKVAEKERRRKLAEEKTRKALEMKLIQEKSLQIEAAAIAASEIKQVQLSYEATQRMLKLCNKIWRNGKHRCYCQKYIRFAPDNIQANSSCE
jgi:hypothetical protein